jgi:hypothetical protein
VIAGGASDLPQIAEANRERMADQDVAAVIKEEIARSCAAARVKLVPADFSDKDFEAFCKQMSEAAAQVSSDKRRITDKGVQGLDRGYDVAYLICEIDHKDILEAIKAPAKIAADAHNWKYDQLVAALQSQVLQPLQIAIGGSYKYEVDQRGIAQHQTPNADKESRKR